jgi:hypothetical protein
MKWDYKLKFHHATAVGVRTGVAVVCIPLRSAGLSRDCEPVFTLSVVFRQPRRKDGHCRVKINRFILMNTRTHSSRDAGNLSSPAAVNNNKVWLMVCQTASVV